MNEDKHKPVPLISLLLVVLMVIVTAELACAQHVCQGGHNCNREMQARQVAQEVAEAAQTEVGEHADRIRTLELEANVDDIPDSNDCLIVFAPRRVLPAENCGEAGAGGDRAGRNCVDSEGSDGAASPFSNITYADAMRIWGRDRAIIRVLNGQLAAIETLGDEQ